MTATVVPEDVVAYLAAVREALADLGTEERDDLLVEVEASLIETAGENGPITARLGPPADFAAELRASAGLPPAPAPAAPVRGGLVAALRAAAGQAAADPHLRAVGRTLAELAPLWWVGRAYAGVAILAKLAGADWSYSHPAIPRIGDQHLAWVLLLAAVVASVALGLRARHGRRPIGRTPILVNLLLGILAVPAAIHLVSVATAPAPRDPQFFAAPSGGPGLAYNGTPLKNIYPYTADGRLLHDVLLFSDGGTPLDVNPGDTDPARRVLTAADGQRIFDSFPIRYFESGTTRVANPNAAPPLQTPTLFTPAARGGTSARRPTRR